VNIPVGVDAAGEVVEFTDVYIREVLAAREFTQQLTAIPVGFSRTGLPLALQLVGPAFADELVLRVGASYKERTDWHLARPETAPAPLDRPAPAGPPAGLPARARARCWSRPTLGICPDELPGLAAALPMVPANADRLRDVAGTRYADPVTVFRA
jgi:aspartyl-tRNA(Asn)/glutamyl-tRNA(Gln) amidotransferase subunit A